MNQSVFRKIFLFLLGCVFVPLAGFSQITSSADAIILTEYSAGRQDNIHIFCGQKNVPAGSLTATFPSGESGNVEWTKFNASGGSFDFFSSDASGGTSSTISDLADGCYRATLTGTAGTHVYTAWVFNDYLAVTAEIPESDCSFFKLNGNFDSPAFSYTDLTNGQVIDINKRFQVEWKVGGDVVSQVLSFSNYDPPTHDTRYTLEVSDRFTCSGQAEVTYTSIVTKAKFSADPSEGEAPLRVTLTNQSENGDAGKFQWFIYKDRTVLQKEGQQNNGIVKDSIMDVLYNDNPVYTFEHSGEYRVKLVSTKVSEQTTCYDTAYLAGYIVADTSLIDAPNVFLPESGNPYFLVKFQSLKRLKITIFNRWGKILQVYENNDVQGYKGTALASAWDGKVGGKLATPGVYYYVVDAVGRDDRRRRTSGFFHLFRGK
jgi:hypothetical protein